MSVSLKLNANLTLTDTGVTPNVNTPFNPGTITTTPPTSLSSAGAFEVPTTAAAIPIGALDPPGYAEFVNLDPTNYMQLITGTGGIAFIRIDPGKSAGPFRFDKGLTAPFWKANTAPVQCQIFITDGNY